MCLLESTTYETHRSANAASRYFYVIDENGAAEVNVTEAKLEEVEILELGENEAVVTVTFDVDHTADLSYDGPDRISYAIPPRKD